MDGLESPKIYAERKELEAVTMPEGEISDEMQRRLEVSHEMERRREQSHYLVAYLAKLYHERSSEGSLTVPVTIREEAASRFVMDVEGHEISFDA